jgi:hypothetical protein
MSAPLAPDTGSTMTANSLFAQLGTLAANTTCPACNRKHLEFVLRCDLDHGACIYTARCSSEACGLSFEIVLSDTPQEVRAIAEKIGPCRLCGSRDRTARLHCSDATMSCAYRLDCSFCLDTARASLRGQAG